MEEKKYEFIQVRQKHYNKDPVFKTEEFDEFEDALLLDKGPILFQIFKKHKRFKYCLIEPTTIVNNEELLLKINRYISFHERNGDANQLVNTYFIGNMEKSVDVSSVFNHQNIILVTKEMIEQWYPKTLDETLRFIIKTFIKEQKYLGERKRISSLDDDILFVDPKLNHLQKLEYKKYLRNCMVDEGLIYLVEDDKEKDLFVLTPKAIDSIQNKDNKSNKDVFIAMKFDGNEKRINAIQNAISEAGFNPIIMNRIETNNWIMPEIFFQIKKARFVVADFSLLCDGAYYEAGYAAALNKTVIHLFDKREETDTNKLHFDIAQKSTIFYEDFKDLIEKLKKE